MNRGQLFLDEAGQVRRPVLVVQVNELTEDEGEAGVIRRSFPDRRRRAGILDRGEATQESVMRLATGFDTKEGAGK